MIKKETFTYWDFNYYPEFYNDEYLDDVRITMTLSNDKYYKVGYYDTEKNIWIKKSLVPKELLND
jgi:hypothetical protein